MASNAYQNYLVPLLADAKEIDAAHQGLRTGQVGRQWRLGALNRAAVVMCLSAWEAYIEEVTKEAVQCFRPPAPHQTLWQSINGDARAPDRKVQHPKCG